MKVRTKENRNKYHAYQILHPKFKKKLINNKNNFKNSMGLEAKSHAGK